MLCFLKRYDVLYCSLVSVQHSFYSRQAFLGARLRHRCRCRSIFGTTTSRSSTGSYFIGRSGRLHGVRDAPGNKQIDFGTVLVKELT